MPASTDAGEGHAFLVDDKHDVVVDPDQAHAVAVAAPMMLDRELHASRRHAH
jgi:hypothetical protein